MARKTVAKVEADLERVRRRRNFHYSRANRAGKEIESLREEIKTSESRETTQRTLIAALAVSTALCFTAAAVLGFFYLGAATPVYAPQTEKTATGPAKAYTAVDANVYVLSANFACQPCEDFKADKSAGRLKPHKFTVVTPDDANWAAAVRQYTADTGRRFTSYPTFWIKGTATSAVGYSTAENLLQRLGLKPGKATPGQATPASSYRLGSLKMISESGHGKCSGTVIAVSPTHAAILSAWHCIKTGKEALFLTPRGNRLKAVLIASSESLDVALFKARNTGVPGRSYVPRDFPKNASRWTAVGYTAGGSMQHKEIIPCPNNGGDYHVQSGKFGGGDSGGGIFADGALVGVISGCEPNPGPRFQNNKHIVPGSNHKKLVGFLKKHTEAIKDCGRWDRMSSLPRSIGIRDRDKYDSDEWSDKFNTQETKRLRSLVDQLSKQVTELKKKLDGVQTPKPGPAGKDGTNGTNGKDGRGIKSVKADAAGNITVVLTDGSEVSAGRIKLPDAIRGDRGPKGDRGDRGPAGQDADAETIKKLAREEAAKIVEAALAKASFRVIFEKGDEDSEPQRIVEVKIGGDLKIPATVFRIRNIDSAGRPVGDPLTDKAPLGMPIKIRFRPPAKASQ